MLNSRGFIDKCPGFSGQIHTKNKIAVALVSHHSALLSPSVGNRITGGGRAGRVVSSTRYDGLSWQEEAARPACTCEVVDPAGHGNIMPQEADMITGRREIPVVVGVQKAAPVPVPLGQCCLLSPRVFG